MSMLKIKCRNVLSCITKKKKKKLWRVASVFWVVNSVLRCPSLPLCACFVSFPFWQRERWNIPYAVKNNAISSLDERNSCVELSKITSQH